MSIMQMSTLAATVGTKLKIKAEGDDAEQLIEALRELVEEKMFDEPPGGEPPQEKQSGESVLAGSSTHHLGLLNRRRSRSGGFGFRMRWDLAVRLFPG